ncbi:PEP-CTERM sorting domain-containing protein [Gloeothece verrucosa]|uniref:PEP-CTERM protein-sorting domain-containing protein n=1 Tax=Gloeothece verrucosa (strain PCC 7822) TaxID=497965 RepID=E0ULG6_GLOV7|nr:PEP-CTERM sorting domain-containing protein [Gloeothece verrucosa]ADN17796.1 hypothetical protein Cyan7822_5943 [Gloeothece verrucosa PCC 7822]
MFKWTCLTLTSGFGVVDVDKTSGGDTAVNSALLIDNITVTSVPEPLTLLGIASAALFGAAFKVVKAN